MKSTIRSLSVILAMALLAPLSSAQVDRQSQGFKLHNIFIKNARGGASIESIVPSCARGISPAKARATDYTDFHGWGAAAIFNQIPHFFIRVNACNPWLKCD